MPLATPHRIDPANLAAFGGQRARRPSRAPSSPQVEQDDSPSLAINNPPRRPKRAADSGTNAPTRQQWHQEHLIDLHQQLQDWAAELDRREAEMTVNSIHENHRQRQIRLSKLRRQTQRARS